MEKKLTRYTEDIKIKICGWTKRLCIYGRNNKKRLKHADLPDLILMDGGKGQVSVAKKVIAEEGLSIPVLEYYGIQNIKPRTYYRKSSCRAFKSTA